MLLKYGFILLGIGFCGFVFYSSSARYLKIKDLPENIISSGERIKYLQILQKYVLISGAGTLISLLTFLSSGLELRIMLPLISTFICGYIYMDLADEIADFDISKKDSLIITDFLKNQLDRSKENQKEDKIKKIDSDSIEKELNEKGESLESLEEAVNEDKKEED